VNKRLQQAEIIIDFKKNLALLGIALRRRGRGRGNS